MSGFIGPALPPGLKTDSESDEGELIGPALPIPKKVARDSCESLGIGPQPPPNLNTDPHVFCESTTSSDQGEDLKANDQNKDQGTMYGPALPTELVEGAHLRSYGPTLPPGFNPESFQSEGDEEEEEIGPMPLVGKDEPKEESSISELKRKREEIESRARAMKDQLTGTNQPKEPDMPKREEWMIELPPEFKPLGLGPRKFRTTKSDTGDRSVWTKTPSDLLKTAQEPQKEKTKKKTTSETCAAVLSKDRKLAEQVSEYNKRHRPEPLMEVHRKRRAEEQSAGERERRPFNRETDLELPTNIVTPAKRRALMKDSAKSLESKFTHGTQSFL